MKWTNADLVVMPISLGIMILTTVLLCFLLRNKSEKIKNIPLSVITITLIVLEIVKQIKCAINGYELWAIPLHFCSTFLIWFPLAQFGKGWVKRLGQTMSFVGGILLIALMYIKPYTIIGNSPELVLREFRFEHTFIFHHLVILYIFLMLGLKLYSPKLKDYKYSLIGITIYATYAIPLAHILNINYCNILYCEAVPLMETIRLTCGQAFYTFILFTVCQIGGILIVILPALVLKLLKKKKAEQTLPEEVIQI